MFVTYLTHNLVSVLLQNCRLSVVLHILLHSHPFEPAASSSHHCLMAFLVFFVSLRFLRIIVLGQTKILLHLIPFLTD